MYCNLREERNSALVAPKRTTSAISRLWKGRGQECFQTLIDTCKVAKPKAVAALFEIWCILISPFIGLLYTKYLVCHMIQDTIATLALLVRIVLKSRSRVFQRMKTPGFKCLVSVQTNPQSIMTQPYPPRSICTPLLAWTKNRACGRGATLNVLTVYQETKTPASCYLKYIART